MIPQDLQPLPSRTLADVREQVAQEVAHRAIGKAEIHEDFKIGVTMTFSKTDDIGFMKSVVESIKRRSLGDYLFAIATIGSPTDTESNIVVFCSSTPDCVQRSVLLTLSKFIGRIGTVHNDSADFCIISIKDIGYTSYDEHALWDVVRKASTTPIDPLDPPPGSRGIDQILSDRRAKLQRLPPEEAFKELQEPEVPAPTFLVDIRPESQRDKEGGITGSLVIERNTLEWSFDPRSPSRLNLADRYDLRIIVFCQDGNASSLAAYSLHELGQLNATDIIGGFSAWRDAGLPVDVPLKARSLLSFAESLDR